MLWLRNINQYDKSVREEFEHIIGQLSVFLSQIFDEDGNVIEGREQGNSVIRFIHYGDIAVNAGFTTGQSTIPQAVNVEKTVVHHLGVNPTGADIKITLLDSTHVGGTRSGTTGDWSVNYCVVEYI